MKLHLFLAVFLTLILISCQKDSEGNSQAAELENLPPIIQMEGLEFAKLGDSLWDLNLSTYNILLIEDSVESAGGYQWLSRTVHTDSGLLVLEGNFIDERQYSDQRLTESTLNRIRIENDYFQTAEGITVGKTFAELEQALKDKELFVRPLPSDGLLDIEDQDGHIHYLIEADQTVFSIILEQANPLSVIPAENRIKYIVVM